MTEREKMRRGLRKRKGIYTFSFKLKHLTYLEEGFQMDPLIYIYIYIYMEKSDVLTLLLHSSTVDFYKTGLLTRNSSQLSPRVGTQMTLES